MTKEEMAKWLCSTIEIDASGFVSEKDISKALHMTLTKQRQIMDKMARELEKLSPKCEAMSEYRKFTAVRW